MSFWGFDKFGKSAGHQVGSLGLHFFGYGVATASLVAWATGSAAAGLAASVLVGVVHELVQMFGPWDPSPPNLLDRSRDVLHGVVGGALATGFAGVALASAALAALCWVVGWIGWEAGLD